MFTFAECPRCGVRWEIAGKKNKRVKCADCKATRQERISYDGEECLAWGGSFDPYNRPILDGVLYLAGVRLCGHSDCVRADHVAKIVWPFE